MKFILSIAVIFVINFSMTSFGEEVRVYKTFDLQGNAVEIPNLIKPEPTKSFQEASKLNKEKNGTVLVKPLSEHQTTISRDSYGNHVESKDEKTITYRKVDSNKNGTKIDKKPSTFYNNEDPNLNATVPNPNKIVGSDATEPSVHQSVSVSKESICHAAGYSGANDELDENGNVTCFKTVKISSDKNSKKPSR